jgi:hypothetical protein
MQKLRAAGTEYFPAGPAKRTPRALFDHLEFSITWNQMIDESGDR